MSTDQLPYRPCVGMMLLNPDNQVFVGKRIDTTSEVWQMPQGGVDEGESFYEAGLRELLEEVGTDKVEIIAESEDVYYYDVPVDMIPRLWGGKYRGQKQKWLVMKFLGKDSDINIQTSHPEFCEWKWAHAQELPDLIVPFKKKLYEDLIEEFNHLIK